MSYSVCSQIIFCSSFLICPLNCSFRWNSFYPLHCGLFTSHNTNSPNIFRFFFLQREAALDCSPKQSDSAIGKATEVIVSKCPSTPILTHKKKRLKKVSWKANLTTLLSPSKKHKLMKTSLGYTKVFFSLFVFQLTSIMLELGTYAFATFLLFWRIRLHYLRKKHLPESYRNILGGVELTDKILFGDEWGIWEILENLHCWFRIFS